MLNETAEGIIILIFVKIFIMSIFRLNLGYTDTVCFTSGVGRKHGCSHGVCPDLSQLPFIYLHKALGLFYTLQLRFYCSLNALFHSHSLHSFHSRLYKKCTKYECIKKTRPIWQNGCMLKPCNSNSAQGSCSW